MKQLIICPHCEEQGNKRVLAELEDGAIKINVKHRGKMHQTIIKGRELVIECGECNKVVFRRSRSNGH